MPHNPPINIRACDSDVVANAVAAALAREYGSGLNVTTVQSAGSVPRYNVCVERRDGRRITNEWVQTLCAFASGAAAVVGFMADSSHPEPHASGCEFCRPAEGDPFTNRPRGEAWTCPYCHTPYTGKERK
jgi:hypothetical protein